ncbi:MAG: hypothetical protein ACHQT9_02800 [Candidatus Saccharimonadales bacterium]
MSTIRSRAIELANDRKYFVSTRSHVRLFEDSGDAKLEADAHLAIVIDHIAHKLASSTAHEQRFLADVRKRPRRPDNEEAVIGHFPAAFGAVYNDYSLVSGVFRKTEVGRKALEASHHYAEVTSLHWADGNRHGARRIIQNNPYSAPEQLIQDALRNFGRRVGQVLWGVNLSDGAEGMDADARQQLVGGSSRDLLRLSALSMHQHAHYSPSDPVIVDNRVSIAPDIESARALPLYSQAFTEAVRPHRGCPALPNLPAIGVLHGGSGIQTLYERASGLIVASNMHTLTIPQEAPYIAA